MTTCYQQFYDAYDQGRFTPTTNLDVKLVYQDYVPDISHTLNDLTNVLITTPNVLTWAEFEANGMSWIVEKMQENISDFIISDPETIIQEVKGVFELDIDVKISNEILAEAELLLNPLKETLNGGLEEEPVLEEIKPSVLIAQNSEKIQSVLQSFQSLGQEQEDVGFQSKFRELKEGGITYMVVCCDELGILCFSEELM